MEQKAVLKLDLHDEKDKKKAMKIVSGFAGVDSITMSMKDGKLTVTGDFDPVHLVEKLRKLFPTHIESVGPAKDEKKGNDQAKTNDGDKKGDDKNNNNAGGKDQKGGGGGGGGAGDKVFPIPYYPPYPYQNYPPRPAPPLYYYDHPRSVGEDPNGCVIC